MINNTKNSVKLQSELIGSLLIYKNILKKEGM
nr:MAG TPA: hypothetical protein [Caudoviricetes sp.]